MSLRLCVYCGSNAGASPAYLVSAGAGLVASMAAQTLPRRPRAEVPRRRVPLALARRTEQPSGTGASQPMVHLTLAGLSEDGSRLLLVSDAGVEFTVDVDARLRAAMRGDHARLGQLEIQMDSVRRPRDIPDCLCGG